MESGIYIVTLNKEEAQQITRSQITYKLKGLCRYLMLRNRCTLEPSVSKTYAHS
jgi:hypothetical protein